MLKTHTFIVFALDHYNPLGVIRSLGENGISPVFIAVKHKFDIGIKSKYLSKYFSVNSVEEGYEILMKKYGGAAKDNLPFLITCDDRTTGFLDQRFDELQGRFLFFQAGKRGRIEEYMNKKKILGLAKRHGLHVLESYTVSRGEIPGGLQYPVITKSISPNIGGWKSDVYICRTEDELKKAYENIKAETVLLQKYIEKKNELCLDGYCINRGKDMFFGIASTYNYQIPGYYSPYMTVSSFQNQEIEKALRAMMKEIGFEGIFSIEFLIDQNDLYYFLEINFRNSTWSYASTRAGMPLPVLWAESTLKGSVGKHSHKTISEGFTAMVEPVDYAKRVESGKIDCAQWIIDFKEADCGFYYAKDDPGPFREALKHWKELG